MWIRAVLVCDDVRLEMGKTLTAVGIHSEHIHVDAAEGPFTLPKLVVLSIVSGLRGQQQISWRQTLTWVGGNPAERSAMRTEPHDPMCDEHHIISVLSPVRFARLGRYQISFELEVAGEMASRDVVFTIGPPDFQPIDA